MLLKRQRERIAREKSGEINEMKLQEIGASEIANTLGISRASVYRCLE